MRVNRFPIFLACSIPLLLTALTFSLAAPASAQTDGDFLTRSVALAQNIQRHTGIPSSVIVAQAVLESGWGRKSIAASNNFFGMKAFQKIDGSINIGSLATGWTWAETKEWDGKQYVDERERFRTYDNMEDSFADLGRLYTLNDRYAAAMQQVDNPKEFARQVARAGYATAPDYDERLIALMDTYNLYQYDLPRDAAEFVGQSEYPTVQTRESFEVYFEVRNTGYARWTGEGEYYLQNENDLSFGTPGRAPPGEGVAPGDVIRWTLRMTAPAEAGQYRTVWKLRHGDVPFGPDMYVDVTVTARPEDLTPLSVRLWAISLVLAAIAVVLFLARSRLWKPRPAP